MTSNTQSTEELRCVVCNSITADASGLCDDHKYNEQPLENETRGTIFALLTYYIESPTKAASVADAIYDRFLTKHISEFYLLKSDIEKALGQNDAVFDEINPHTQSLNQSRNELRDEIRISLGLDRKEDK